MELPVSSVGPFRVNERAAGPNQWRGAGPEGSSEVRVSLVDGAAAEAARARLGFSHARLLPTLHVEAAPEVLGAAAGVGEGASWVVTAEPGGPSLREAVTRGGPLAPLAAASLALLLAEPLRALGERGSGHGNVSPDGVFLPGSGRGEPSLGVAGFDAEERRAYFPPEPDARPEAIDRWGLVGCLWFALRGAEPGPSFGRHAPTGRPRRGGRGPGRGGREALEALVRRGLSPREADRYPDWVTLMIELGAWLERYGSAPAGRPLRTRAAGPGLSLAAFDALARHSLTDALPAGVPSLQPFATPSLPPFATPTAGRPTPGGPWATSAEAAAEGAARPAGDSETMAEGAARPAGGGRRRLRSAVLVLAGVLGGGGAVGLWQGAFAARAPVAAPAEPAPSAEAPADEAPDPETFSLPAGARLAAPLRDESPAALYQCFSGGFAPRSFAPGHDFRPLCAEPDAPSGTRLLQRALASGRRGREASPALREWAHYGWYELAVVAALRDRCCGAFPPTRVQPTPPPCASLNESLGRVGVASNAMSEPGLDLAIDDFHQRSDCVAREGYAPLYGRAKTVQRWEETNFRVFVRRFRRAAGAPARGPSSEP